MYYNKFISSALSLKPKRLFPLQSIYRVPVVQKLDDFNVRVIAVSFSYIRANLSVSLNKDSTWGQIVVSMGVIVSDLLGCIDKILFWNIRMISILISLMRPQDITHIVM